MIMLTYVLGRKPRICSLKKFGDLSMILKNWHWMESQFLLWREYFLAFQLKIESCASVVLDILMTCSSFGSPFKKMFVGWPLLAWFPTLFKVCWFWLCSRHGFQDQGYRAIHHEPALPWWDPRWRQGRDETAFPDIPERVLLIWLFLKSYFSIRNLGSSECHILLTLENMERLPLSDAMTTYKEKRSVEAESWEKPWGGSGSVCSHPSVCVSSYDGENNKKRETLFSQRAIKPLLLNGFWGASSSHSK